MPRLRLRATRAQLAGLSLILVSGASLAACGSGSSGPSAFTLVAKAFANAGAASWVHEVRTATETGHSYMANDYVSTNSGRESIVLDGSIASVIVLPTSAYIRGNAKAVADYFGLTKKDPGKLAGKWISLKSTDNGYASLRTPVTIKSDFQSYSLLGPLTEGSDTTIDGQEVLPINGFVTGPTKAEIPATVYVTTTGTVLPVEFLIATGSIKSKEIWNGWNHAIALAAPSPSIPIKTAVGH